ncbi:uncharacterized protein L201_000030 [Kwoniella dendrophila CBS 6074]|uniref:histidine kinase n=1 Tax=Kwoniella dendrophila CBS 6074 TaxID=1295534 RepID=A0AAX4JJS5_9TREE
MVTTAHEADVSSASPSAPSLYLQEWKSFLTGYASGDWNPESTPVMPNAGMEEHDNGYENCPESIDEQESETDCNEADDDPKNIYSSHIIDEKIARKIRQFKTDKDYLPPPRSPHELLREKIILEYDILGPIQAGNIQSAVDVISAFFPGTVVTFTLFNNAIQTFVAISGPEEILEEFDLKNGMWVDPRTSLCGHSILLDGQILFVPSLEDDWRFRSNPYVKAGMRSYIGAAVSLELDPSNTSPQRTSKDDFEGEDKGSTDSKRKRVGIGSLNVLYMNKYLKEMTAQQEMVVRNITKMLETQLRATWEGHIRTREAKVRRAITDLIEEGFVGDQSENLQPYTEDIDGGKSGVISGGGSLTMFEDLANSAMDKLIALTSELDAICMVDIRSLRIQTSPNSKTQPRYEIDPSSTHPISIIAFAPRDEMTWPTPPKTSALISYLDQAHSVFTFSEASTLSGLEMELPINTKSHIVMPFFTLNQPAFAIIGVSKSSDMVESSTVTIARSIGSILLAKAVQSRVMEADAAKTAFLSSISHELRTPMHSILSGLSLAHASSESQDWNSTKSLLDIVETSGNTLYRILDDVLDFDPVYNRKSKITRKVTVDLLKSAQDTIQMCLTRSEDLETGSSINVEYEERDWTVSLDEARYHRILINGITNAMKFCKNGLITVSLSTAENSTKLVTRITDNGIGIDDKVLPRLLEPFTKQDVNTPGTGLGLFITKNLVNSMGGIFAIKSALGQGTVFEAILPITFDKPISSDQVFPMKSIMQHTGPLAASLRTKTPSPPISPPVIVEVNDPVQDINNSLKTNSNHVDDHYKNKTGTNSENRKPEQALKVMVVDDNRICRLLLLKSIQKGITPVECSQAADGEKAVKLFQNFKPDLVITDVSMPIMDGITAAQKMREISEDLNLPQCKIYALTGLGSSDPRLKNIGMEGSAALDGWLVKGQDDLKAIQQIISDTYQNLKNFKNTDIRIGTDTDTDSNIDTDTDIHLMKNMSERLKIVENGLTP